MRRTAGWIVLALSAWAGAAAGADQPLRVRLRAECRPRGPLVRLEDVADLEGDEADVVRASLLPLFPAPARGKTRTIRAQEIREWLALHGWAPSAVRVEGGPAILLAGGSPAAASSRRPPAPPPASRKRPQELVVVAARPIRRGTPLVEADLTLAPAPTGSVPGRLVRRAEELIGLEAVRAIATGQPIAREMVRPPLLVRRQELVTVFARAPGVQVRAAARALEDGVRGDWIQVELTPDRRRLTARVSGLQEVEIVTPGGPKAGEPTSRRSGVRLASPSR